MSINKNHALFKTGFNDNDDVIKLSGNELKHMQNILLMMLKDFIKISKNINIDYSLSGGSVLGALRHNGFIPWDDDIDINIARADYNKLKKAFDVYDGEKYYLADPLSCKEHTIALPQMKLRNTIYKTFIELTEKDAECGICMDLFVIENTFDNVILRNIHGLLCLVFGYILTCRKTYSDMSELKKYIKNDDLYKAFKKKANIGKIFKFIKIETIMKITIKCYSMCKNNNSKYVTIPTGRKHFFGELCKRSELCVYKEAPFENLKVKIPDNAEEYMRRLFGEGYMELPPVEKREQHPIMKLDFGNY